MDYFLPGFGNAICRYDIGETVQTSTGTDEAGEEVFAETRPRENVEIDYVPWKDWLWGPSKVPHLVPWWSKAADMTRAQLVKRFGAIGKLVPLARKKDSKEEDPWSRARVHEIYEKDAKKVYWFCETFNQLLDMKDDPLGLEGFYPFPSQPLIANLTTSKVVPRPYYALHQDQYRQINILMSRIRELVEAIRITGVCDKAHWEVLQRVLMPGERNRLIPLPNFAAFAEKGGMKGVIDWFPIEQAIQSIAILQQQLMSEIDLLHQATGFSDIMRGEATQAGATATEQRAKTKFGSVRIQRLQDEIARFATDLLSIKAQIIAKHFAPETIYERANVRFMPIEDQKIAMQAIELLKSDISCYRVEVKPEAVALADFAAMKQERSEVIATLGEFFQRMMPFVQSMPAARTGVLKVGQWLIAGVRGSSQIEGVFDSMIQQSEQAEKQAAENPQAAPPDPKVVAEQMKLQGQQMKQQGDMQREQMKLRNDLVKGQADVQNDAQREENQRQSNVQEAFQRKQIEAAFPKPVAPKNGGLR
jgi:hypothetical protein